MTLKTIHMPMGQQSIVMEIDGEVADLARWIVTYFESEAQTGIRFRDGQTVEIGWSLLLLRQVDKGLEVFEPDFDSMPIRWCKGVNNTVRQLHLQRAVCDLFGCDPLFPTTMDAGIISPNWFDSRSYTMSRDMPENSDSGWVFFESGYEGTEGRFCSLYELGLRKLEIVPFLALPSSSQVLISPGAREVTANGTTKTSADCEFLKTLARLKGPR